MEQILGKRNKTGELIGFFVTYLVLTWAVPMYELRRTRGFFLVEEEKVTNWERVKFEFTNAHRAFYFSLICMRLTVSRVLAWLMVKLVVLMSPLKWAKINVKQLQDHVHCLIPKVSCGGTQNGGSKIRKRRIRKRKLRSTTRLAAADAACREVVEQKVLNAEKAAFFAKLALAPTTTTSSSSSSSSDEAELTPEKSTITFGLQKYFTLYLNRKLAR